MRRSSRLFCCFLFIVLMMAGCKKRKDDKTGPGKEKDQTEEARPDKEPGEAMTKEEAENRAKALFLLISRGRIDEAYARFGEKLKELLTKEKLKEQWEQASSRMGALLSMEAGKAKLKDGLLRVRLRAKLENASLDLTVAFTTEGKVDQLLMEPIKPPSWQPPAYAKTTSFDEVEITVGKGELGLPGTLTLPRTDEAKRVPAVVLVHGFGPNDRDESIGSTRIFKDIAWGLASAGIAVLRYEKITSAHPREFFKKIGGPNRITIQNETIDDALKAVGLLHRHPRIDPKRIVYVGHGQGAQAAPRVCVQEPRLRGFVMMAGPARPSEDVVLDQLTYIASLDTPRAKKVKKMLPAVREAVKRVKDPRLSPDIPNNKMPLGIPASMFLDLRKNPLEKSAGSCTRPLLVLQGEADFQATMEDLALLKRWFASNKQVRFKSYPRLGYTFIDLGVVKARPEHYLTVGGNVAKEVVSDLVDFVKGLEQAAFRP